MTPIRRIVAFTLLGSATLLAACTPFTKVTGDGATLGKIEGKWTVRYVGGKELDPAVKPEIAFDTAKGTVGGFDGCNRFNGTFTFDGGVLKAKTAGTRMACTSDAARQASAAISNLFANGAEVVELSMYGTQVLMMRNESSEIRLLPTLQAK